METQKTKKKKTWLIVLIIALIGFGISLGVFLWIFYNQQTSGKEYEEIKPTVVTETTVPGDSSDAPPDNVAPTTVKEEITGEINFTELQEINKDLYAWIRIPNTSIDYPVAQADASTDDIFYLEHNMYKEWAFAGCLYTEKVNKKDFSDPNTIIYGHNMANDTMFRHLIYFRDEAFFEENPYIYIYLPGRKLTYEIFSAYEYDDRHIMNSFDFSDKQVFQEYLDYAMNPARAMMSTTRDIQVTSDDKIITLSTCLGDIDTSRYLVQGVLIKDEPG